MADGSLPRPHSRLVTKTLHIAFFPFHARPLTIAVQAAIFLSSRFTTKPSSIPSPLLHEHAPHLLPLARRGLGCPFATLHSHASGSPNGRQPVHTPGLVGQAGRHGMGAKRRMDSAHRGKLRCHFLLAPRFLTHHLHRRMGLEPVSASQAATLGMPRTALTLGRAVAPLA